jgi:hypothetical protein
MANDPNAGVSQQEWQNFMSTMQAQNAALTQQLGAAQAHIAQTNQSLHDAAIEQLEPEKKAAQLQAELNAIKTYGAQAQAQQMSNDVWQRRDAEAAAHLLQTAGMNGDEPGLYRQPWDVNWMPRYAASVKSFINNRRSQNNNNPRNNPANAANVGNGTGSGLPEIDADKASGADLIMFALQKGKA